MCVCPPDSKIKYSLFCNIYVLMFTYYTVCYSIGIFYAVVRQISKLFIDNKDSVFCLYSFKTHKKKMGSAALAAAVPYPGKATRISHKGQ